MTLFSVKGVIAESEITSRSKWQTKTVITGIPDLSNKLTKYLYDYVIQLNTAFFLN